MNTNNDEDIKLDALMEIVNEIEVRYSNHPNILDDDDWMFVTETLAARAAKI